jgi:hypothetical protein
MDAYTVEVVLVMVFCKYNEPWTISVEQNCLRVIKDNCSVFQKPPLSSAIHLPSLPCNNTRYIYRLYRVTTHDTFTVFTV